MAAQPFLEQFEHFTHHEQNDCLRTAVPMKDPKTTSGAADIGKRAERSQVMLAEEELTALDDWRFTARMPSRSAAVRELIRRGLAAEGYFAQATQNDQSSSFGILDRKD